MILILHMLTVTISQQNSHNLYEKSTNSSILRGNLFIKQPIYKHVNAIIYKT